MTPFDEFWATIPKYKGRSKKLECRALFQQLTTKGMDLKFIGVEDKVFVDPTPEDIVRGAKAWHTENAQDPKPNSKDFAQGAQVWLRRGGWEDYDGDELDEMVERCELYQRREAEDAQAKLRVV